MGASVMFALGQVVKSRRDASLTGVIVGLGVLSWPASDSDSPLRSLEPQPVYLVRVRGGSSSLGPACAVLQHDQVEEHHPLKIVIWVNTGAELLTPEALATLAREMVGRMVDTPHGPRAVFRSSVDQGRVIVELL